MKAGNGRKEKGLSDKRQEWIIERHKKSRSFSP